MIELGPYTVGERHTPFTYTFLNYDGTVKDLTGYNPPVRQVLPPNGVLQEDTTTFGDPAAGEVEHVWGDVHTGETGVYQCLLWVGNGTHRYASEMLRWEVHANLGSIPNV